MNRFSKRITKAMAVFIRAKEDLSIAIDKMTKDEEKRQKKIDGHRDEIAFIGTLRDQAKDMIAKINTLLGPT
jgi:hypothetical protein